MAAPLKSRVRLTLQARVNVVLGGIFILGLLTAVYTSYNEERSVAEQEVLQDARLVLDFADVTRAYTNEEVKQHIASGDYGEFPKPLVPSYASRRVTERLRLIEAHEDIRLREVSPNPMNPKNLPDSFEMGLFNDFHEDLQLESSGRVEGKDGPEVYVARPIIVSDAGCLSCHGSPKDGGEGLATAYGVAGGRNWKDGELVGVQVVRAPLGTALDRAHSRVLRVGVALCSIFALMAFALNLLLRRYFFGPLRDLTSAAVRMSTGERLDLKDGEGGEELRSLATALTRLRMSVDKAIALAERGRSTDRTEELRMGVPSERPTTDARPRRPTPQAPEA